MHPSIILKLPAECTDAELASFESALHAAGESGATTLTERIRRAECLAFAHDADGKATGVGALKCPKTEHRAALFKRASAQVSSEPFTLELGWLASSAEAMPPLVAALAAHAGDRPVFVIAGTDEAALQAALAQHGFRAGSAPYSSSHGKCSNQVFVRGA